MQAKSLLILTCALVALLTPLVLAKGRSSSPSHQQFTDSRQYIVALKPGTSENEMRRIAEQLEQEQLVIITHYYTTVMMGFSFSVPFDNVESALTALEEEPSLEVIEEDQQMSIDPILSE